jgi:hypothetical protein
MLSFVADRPCINDVSVLPVVLCNKVYEAVHSQDARIVKRVF